MRKNIGFFSLFFVLILFTCSYIFSELTLYTEISPPGQILNEDGTLSGFSIEIVNEILKRLNSKSEILVVPWIRGYTEMTNVGAKDIALFVTAFSEARRDIFKWVGPFSENNMVFFSSSDSELIINSLDDAKKVKSIGVYLGDAREQFLKENGFTNFVSISDNKINLKKLMAGKIDLWFSSDMGVSTLTKSENIPMNKIKRKYQAKSTGLFIAFSLGTSDDIVRQWQKAFDSIKADGTMKIILDKYNLPMPSYKIPPRLTN